MLGIEAPGLSASIAPAPPDPFSALSTDQFVEVIFAELARQDPLAPSDTSALLDQLATLRSIQSDLDLGQQLEALTAQSQLTAASSLIGRFVTGRDASGALVGDVVVSVSRTSGGPIINLANGARFGMDAIEEVMDLQVLGTVVSEETP